MPLLGSRFEVDGQPGLCPSVWKAHGADGCIAWLSRSPIARSIYCGTDGAIYTQFSRMKILISVRIDSAFVVRPK